MPVTLARDVIFDFLSGHSQPICGQCLSKRTGLPPVRIVDGWLDLELNSDFRVRTGRCSDCRETGDVIRRVGS